MKKNIQTALVYGGAGFIGSKLCRFLIEREYRVICIDTCLTGSKDAILDLLSHPHFEFIQEDVCTYRHPHADYIFNLASPASPVYYQRDPVATTKTNVLGAINVLELAKERDIPVLLTSTSEVYGNPEIHPQPESYVGHVNPIGPRACYDEGKRCAETLFFDFHRQHAVRIKVARIFNTYGPGMHVEDGRVIPNFIIQALRNQPITVYGDGTQTRSFCYVDDIVKGLYSLIRTERIVTGPINLGRPGEKTILQTAELIRELCGSSSEIVHYPLPQDDPRRREPDIRLAKTELGWEPSVDVVEGLSRTIEYFRQFYADEGKPQLQNHVTMSER